VCRPTLGDSIFASNDQSYAPATALGSLSNGQSGQGHRVTASDQGTGTAPNSSMYRRHNSPTHYIKVIIHLLSSLSDGQSGQGHCVTANDQGTGTARNSSIAITHQLTTSKSSPNHKALCPMDRVDKDTAAANDQGTGTARATHQSPNSPTRTRSHHPIPKLFVRWTDWTRTRTLRPVTPLEVPSFTPPQSLAYSSGCTLPHEHRGNGLSRCASCSIRRARSSKSGSLGSSVGMEHVGH
jgi:hypothetical protein